MEFTIHQQVLAIIFTVAVVLGAVINKTHFCTMGAVSDWVNMGSTGRLGSWLCAMAVAILGVLGLSAAGLIELGTDTFPPYRTANFAWLRYLVGGFLFGIGMTLASGCSSKTLVRVGGGNLKSLVVTVVAAYCSYLMLWGEDPLAPGEGFFNNYFMTWIEPTVINLAAHGVDEQGLAALVGAVIGAEDGAPVGWLTALVVGVALLVFALRQAQFRNSLDNVLGGVVVGLAVVIGWWVTAGPMGQEWLEWADFADTRPTRVAVQSFTFVSPMGDTWRYLNSPGDWSLIGFGVVALVGVILGSLVFALISGRFRIEWFTSAADLFRHLVGGALLGIGGVLAMGCTIGQAVTGISTLALGSFLAFAAIFFGSALTMKIQYYKMVYEDQATFIAALSSSLADLHLVPQRLRKLQAV